MPFEIIRNDITKVKADVIVNTANPRAVIGAGTDSAIYHAAGEKELLAERKKIGDIAPGQAVETPAFGLQAKYIIHTVGPVWIDGNHGERETLHSCYRNSLNLADKLKAESIAFPLIATGVYGFPKDEALNIALQEIGSFLLTHEMQVILVVFDRKSFELSGSLIRGINQYIDEHGVGLVQQDEYNWAEEENRSSIALVYKRLLSPEMPAFKEPLMVIAPTQNKRLAVTKPWVMDTCPLFLLEKRFSTQDPRLLIA